jgi:hypothetical protein
MASYGRLPLTFEPNLGQTDGQVRFLARGGGMTAFFTDTETVLVLGHSEQTVVRMKLEKSEKPRRVAGVEKQPGISNYFIGNDPAKWRTDVPHYARIEYQGVYPGDPLAELEGNALDFSLTAQKGPFFFGDPEVFVVSGRIRPNKSGFRASEGHASARPCPGSTIFFRA